MSRSWRALALLCVAAGCTFSLDRTLSPGEITAHLVFLGTDGSKLPAKGAHVSIEASNLTATTDSNGVFVLSNLPPEAYTLDLIGANAAEGTGLRLPVTLSPLVGGTANGLDLGTIVLEPLGGIQGSVVLNGNTVAGVSVVLSGISETESGPNGFEFADLLPGQYDVSVVYVNGSTTQIASVSGIQVAPRVVTQLGAIDLSTAPAVSQGSVAGQAVAVGQPAAIIDVELLDTSASSMQAPTAQTQSSFYTVPSLPPGVYTIVASLPGDPPVGAPFVVVGGQTTQVPTIILSTEAAPDGGIEDAGSPDGGVDAGMEDAGADAGMEDAGADAGAIDAGPVDAGVDAGMEDAGIDAGPVDAGVDAGLFDAGVDAGPVDAGADAGLIDAGIEDAGVEDAGPPVDGGIWLTTIAGNGLLARQPGTGTSTGTAAFSQPMSVVSDSEGNLYVTDEGNPRTILKIDPSENVTMLFGGDGGSQLAGPSQLAIDSFGNIDIADQGGCLWQSTPAGALTLLAGACDGDGGGSLVTGAQFENLMGVAIDGVGDIYVSDDGASAIYKFTKSGSMYSLALFAGTPNTRGNANGQAGTGQLASPGQLAFGPGFTHLYVVDAQNNEIRAIDSTGTLSTVISAYTALPDGGLSFPAWNPTGVAVSSSGKIFLSTEGAILELVVADELSTISLTNANGNGFMDGPSGSAGPSLISWDSYRMLSFDLAGNLLFADGPRVRRMQIQGNATGLTWAPQPPSVNNTGLVTTSVEYTGQLPFGMCIDKTDDLFISASGGEFVEWEGLSLDGGGTEVGPGQLASMPWSIATTSGAITYAAAPSANIIEAVLPDGGVELFAGDGDAGHADNAMPSKAEFFAPQGVAVDSAGNVYVADTQNNLIRAITSEGVSTLAGSGTAGFADGKGTQAQFFHPYNLSVDSTGTKLFVADTGNNAIRELDIASETVSTVVGNGTPGNIDGTGGLTGSARLNLPGSVVEDSLGRLVIMDTWNGSVRLYDLDAGYLGTVVNAGSNSPSVAVDTFNRGYFGVSGEGWQINRYSCAAEWCGPYCFDETSDPAHCGGCDNKACTVDSTSNQVAPTCVGGTCSTLTELWAGSQSTLANGLVMAGGDLYWTDGAGNLLTTGTTVGGTITTVASSVNASLYWNGLATDGTNVFVVVDNTKIEEVQPDGGTSMLVTGETTIEAIAADATHVYWTTGTGTGTVDMVTIPTNPTSGAPPVTALASGRQEFLYYGAGQQLVVDGTNVYWQEAPQTAGGPLNTLAVPIVGGSVTTVVSDAASSVAGAFAVSSSTVWWASGGGPLRSAPLSGPNQGVITTLTSDTYQAADMVVDSDNVYWTDDDAGKIWRFPTTGSASAPVLFAGRINGFTNSPTTLILDSKDVYWIDLNNVPEVFEQPK